MNCFLNGSFLNMKNIILIGLLLNILVIRGISSFLRKCTKSFLFWVEDMSWFKVHWLGTSYSLSSILGDGRVIEWRSEKNLFKKKFLPPWWLPEYIVWERTLPCKGIHVWYLPPYWASFQCRNYVSFTTVVQGPTTVLGGEQVLINICWTIFVQIWRNSCQSLKRKGSHEKGVSMSSS